MNRVTGETKFKQTARTYVCHVIQDKYLGMPYMPFNRVSLLKTL